MKRFRRPWLTPRQPQVPPTPKSYSQWIVDRYVGFGYTG
jgi:hypothetical protein